MTEDRAPEQVDPMDPLGLTPTQRAYSNAFLLVDMETPAWWSMEFREGVIHMRTMNEMRRQWPDGMGIENKFLKVGKK